jgi:hypothetical protein
MFIHGIEVTGNCLLQFTRSLLCPRLVESQNGSLRSLFTSISLVQSVWVGVRQGSIQKVGLLGYNFV